MMVKNRRTALAEKKTKYLTGKVCASGHFSPRYASNGRCVLCVKHERDNLTAEQRRRAAKRNAGWRFRNADLVRSKTRIAKGYPVPTRACPQFCEICGKNNRSGHALSLDHDHETGLFRGWLCKRCNMALGYFGDNLTGIDKVHAYLRRANGL